MGFDIFAVEPTDKTNDYFRSNVWYWRPLWNMVKIMCNELSQEDFEGGSYNDGYLIDKDKSLSIGNKLKIMLETNKFDEYKEKYEESLSNLPKRICTMCKGDGEFIDHKCKDCKGSGKLENFNTYYRLDKELTTQFYKFCINSGGFQIC